MNKKNIGTKFKYSNGTKLTSEIVDTCSCVGCYFDGLQGHRCYERQRGKNPPSIVEIMYCGKGSREGDYIIYKKA